MQPVDVVFPCRNEAEALPALLAGLPAGYRAIVADNDSSDASASIARAYGATVVRVEQLGYGAAVAGGLAAATAEFVVVCDADGSIPPGCLPALVAPVAAGLAELAIAERRPVGRSAWPWPGRLANRRLAALLRRRTGLGLRDLGPARACRRQALLELGVHDRRSGYPVELVLRAAASGWRIAQVPTPYLPRLGRSKVTGTLRGTAQAVLDARRRLREFDR